ncbi:hypothetical protein [Bradyrhizobium sp.]|uniref:hypothetical protein n=1 Tax=Bradyrhizobium sp. TaxID=376 RepID=UPI0025C37759|nr:hypothetical protein [Bradyrhizobium sp.]
MGNNDVGEQIPARRPGLPVIGRMARIDGAPELQTEAPNTARTRRPGNCGAMSQQCGNIGNYSTPQKLVRLVGCRDTKAGSGPWVRPGIVKS